MYQFELLLGLLAMVAVLAILAPRLRVPYPILLVLGGLVLALLPGLPQFQLAPDLVLLIFFPPLIYAAAFRLSPGELRTRLRPIASLAIGLVLATIAAVALVAHAAIAGFSWGAAFGLAAILSNTDPVVATSLAGRMAAPRSVSVILEGEGLFNDAISLVAYRLVVAAVAAGAIAYAQAGAALIVAALGGVAIGLAVGWLSTALQRSIEDPSVVILLILLTPFAAWVPADTIGASAVLAVVVASVYRAQRAAALVSAEVRLEAGAIWDELTFILQGLLFFLIGLQLRATLPALAGRSLSSVLSEAAWVWLAVIVVRILWSFGVRWLTWSVNRALRPAVQRPAWKVVAAVAWGGMRGGDSLAPALALPLLASNGVPFPDRDLIIFLTFCVIVASLLIQGLSLSWLLQRLGIANVDAERQAEAEARRLAAQAALAHLDEIASEPGVPGDLVDRWRARYEHRLHDLNGEVDASDADRHAAESRLHRELLAAEREEASRLHREGRLGDEAWAEMEHELDLEESRALEEGN